MSAKENVGCLTEGVLLVVWVIGTLAIIAALLAGFGIDPASIGSALVIIPTIGVSYYLWGKLPKPPQD